MTKVIGVKFKTGGRVYYFDPAEQVINPGDGVIVETARGMEFGDVTQGVTDVPESQVVAPLKPVIRVATESDWNMRRTNAAKEGDAFAVCQKKIEQHGLDMKLVAKSYFISRRMSAWISGNWSRIWPDNSKQESSCGKLAFVTRPRCLADSVHAAVPCAAKHFWTISDRFPSRWQRNRTCH